MSESMDEAQTRIKIKEMMAERDSVMEVIEVLESSGLPASILVELRHEILEREKRLEEEWNNSKCICGVMHRDIFYSHLEDCPKCEIPQGMHVLVAGGVMQCLYCGYYIESHSPDPWNSVFTTVSAMVVVHGNRYTGERYIDLSYPDNVTTVERLWPVYHEYLSHLIHDNEKELLNVKFNIKPTATNQYQPNNC